MIFNYLVGNNDAHGKNFSLLYTGIGTATPEIRLAPLYDIVSTVYYPDLSTRHGDENRRRILIGEGHAKGFRAAGGRAGLAKPLVRRAYPN